MFNAQYIAVYFFELGGERVGCRGREVWREGHAVVDAGGEEREEAGYFVRGYFGGEDDATEVAEPVEAGGVGFAGVEGGVEGLGSEAEEGGVLRYAGCC